MCYRIYLYFHCHDRSTEYRKRCPFVPIQAYDEECYQLRGCPNIVVNEDPLTCSTCLQRKLDDARQTAQAAVRVNEAAPDHEGGSVHGGRSREGKRAVTTREADEGEDEGEVVKGSKEGKVVEKDEKPTCRICYSEEINAVFVECGHMCACIDCARKVCGSDGICPICRKRARWPLRVYQAA